MGNHPIHKNLSLDTDCPGLSFSAFSNGKFSCEFSRPFPRNPDPGHGLPNLGRTALSLFGGARIRAQSSEQRVLSPLAPIDPVDGTPRPGNPLDPGFDFIERLRPRLHYLPVSIGEKTLGRKGCFSFLSLEPGLSNSFLLGTDLF